MKLVAGPKGPPYRGGPEGPALLLLLLTRAARALTAASFATEPGTVGTRRTGAAPVAGNRHAFRASGPSAELLLRCHAALRRARGGRRARGVVATAAAAA